MSAFDIFCGQLLEEAKRFLEKAIELEKRSSTEADGVRAYQHACLLLTICSLEAYVNGVADEMALSEKLPTHVRGLLLEKDVRLEKGEFVLSDALKMYRLTDRIELLYRKYSGEELNDSVKWWDSVKLGIRLRNKISHPKEGVVITNAMLERVLKSVIDCLSALYKAVYKRNFPKSHLQLNSKLDF